MSVTVFVKKLFPKLLPGWERGPFYVRYYGNGGHTVPGEVGIRYDNTDT